MVLEVLFLCFHRLLDSLCRILESVIHWSMEDPSIEAPIHINHLKWTIWHVTRLWLFKDTQDFSLVFNNFMYASNSNVAHNRERGEILRVGVRSGKASPALGLTPLTPLRDM
ncbi:hypothetical protein PIB30_044276 [Stylosanthes scabra]|uniref:Uncharacterized protein n=1 Tax=Stylosanthes scabra TaxID=79078 RepID=A0ABU6SFZ8_9FABA|nr:hypothetical protein [Stylosanthes scabra]